MLNIKPLLIGSVKEGVKGEGKVAEDGILTKGNDNDDRAPAIGKYT